MDTNQKVEWLQIEFPKLWSDMENSNHHFNATTLNPYHLEGRVSTHTLMVAKIAELYNEDDIVQWAALLHDIGKPSARIEIPEKTRARFVQHESISMFLAIDILNRTDMSTEDKIMTLRTIAGHSLLFDLVLIEDNDLVLDEKALTIFEGERTFLSYVSRITRCDTLGRFAKGADARTKLGELIVNRTQTIVDRLVDKPDINITKNRLTILCGLPGSGKSSYIETLPADTIVISRDNVLEAIAARMNITYNEAFHLQANDKQVKTAIDDEIARVVQSAKSTNANVVVDMTNLSKKSRRRWIGQFGKHYRVECILFLTGMSELARRNEIRSQAGKSISDDVYLHMMKSFTLPMYNEGISRIEYRLFEGNTNATTH
jgi:putative nucleotidyltransferase with HDIG domain